MSYASIKRCLFKKSKPKIKKEYPPVPRIYEVYNCLTHALGAGLAVVGMIMLVNIGIIENSSTKIFSAVVYGLSMIILYSMSALYHIAEEPKTKTILRIFDHCSIFLLIAGSYTPFTILLLKDVSAIFIGSIIWITALLGISLNIINLEKYKTISMICYVSMGWTVLLALPQVFSSFHPNGIWLLLFGGLSYTIGILFYKQKRKPIMHVIWHLFVLAGTAFQFFSIYIYLF